MDQPMRGDELKQQAKKPHKTIIAIAIPAILANSSAPMVGLIDTWAIGHLTDPAYLAAIGLGTVIFNFIFWAFGFLRMGTTGIVAQAWGKQDSGALMVGIWQSFALALSLGLVLIVAQEAIFFLSIKALAPPQSVEALTAEYFNIRIWAAPATLLVYATSGIFFGLARTGLVLIQQLVLNVSNALLNVTLVVGMGLDVDGVAWGTLIAQWIAALVGLWLLARLLDTGQLLATLKAFRQWLRPGFARLIAVNGYIFVRTILLMTALSLVMRVSGGLGEAEMAASHVVMQFMLLIALGLDGFAHATEAMAGAAWGDGNRAAFRRWVVLTSTWAFLTSLLYALLFLFAGHWITNLLTDIESIRLSVSSLMPLVILLPVVSVACYQFDGVFIAATAGAEMMFTMAIALGVYLLALSWLVLPYGLHGLWSAMLIFLAARGIAQAIWYPRLEAKLSTGETTGQES
jgi:MATE family multidrug resistance protein